MKPDYIAHCAIGLYYYYYYYYYYCSAGTMQSSHHSTSLYCSTLDGCLLGVARRLPLQTAATVLLLMGSIYKKILLCCLLAAAVGMNSLENEWEAALVRQYSSRMRLQQISLL